MGKIIFPDLSYKITGICFNVHRKLGRFYREKQYGDALELLLKEKQISYKREHEIGDSTLSQPEGNKVDFLIEDKIILEIKAKKFITKEDYNQMQRYLAASNLELGLIVNFRNTYLKPKRVLNAALYLGHSGDNLGYSGRPYEILEHKADIKIKVFGKTMEELYKNAVGAMASILCQASSVKRQDSKISKILVVKSADREILLVDFLNDVLGESQINQAVYPEAKFIDFHPEGIQGFSYLKAEIIGYPIERFDEDIKAVTYHDLSIRQNENSIWEATILFDV